MNQHRVPEIPAQPPAPSAVQQAYGSGYLDGHLAGWRDAIAAQVAQAAFGAQMLQDAPAPPVVSPSVDTPPVAAPPFAGPQVPQQQLPPPHALQQPVQQHMQGQAFPAGPVMAGAMAPPNVMPQPVRRQPGPMAAPIMAQRPTQVPLDPAALAARKGRRETQNINITLYVASLLMVAAAALFVGSSQPVPVRLVGVWLATVLFYAAGLMLHSKVARLKPAAVAFTGTALAIIPFAGLAMYNLGFPDAPAVWLVTSLIGTVAYVVAAVRLQSRLVVYLSLAFLLSTAWSSVAVLGAALAWYFAALVVFSALLSLAGHLLDNGEGEASLYAKPLSDLGPWFAPVGIAGSLVFSLALNAADHTLVLLAGTIYYAAMVTICAPVMRRWNYLGLRASVTLAAPFIGWLIQPELAWSAGAFTLGLALQSIVLAYRRDQLATFLGASRWVDRDVFTSVPVVAAGAVAWTVGLAVPFGPESGNEPFAALGLVVALVTATAVVPAFLPKGEWLPLPAVALTLLCSPFLAASDWMVLTAIGVVYSAARHLSARNTTLGHAMLIVARVLVGAFAAAALAHFIPAQPGKVHLILAVMAGVSALQLLADAMLARFGAANPATSYSAAAWAVVGTGLVVLLSVSYAGQSSLSFLGTATLPQLRVEFLVAALAMGLAAAVLSLTKLPHAGGFSRAEVVAPSYLVIAALCTGPVLAAGGASVAWAAGLAYLLLAGSLLRRQKETLHRWAYWRAARAVSLLLAIALFQLWRESDPATALAGTPVGLGAIMLLALLPQLVILTVVAVQGRRVWGLSVDVGLTLAAVVLMATPGIVAPEAGFWTARTAVVLAAAAVAALAACGTLRSAAMSTVLWAGPGALALLSLLSLADRPQAAVVVGIFALTSGFLAARAGTGGLRGGHFLLARAAVFGLAWIVVRELTDNLEVVSLVLTGVLLLQLGLQYVAGVPGRFNAAVGQEQFLRTGLWLLLGAQVLVPFAYVVLSLGFQPSGTALRWVVAVDLVVLAASALAAQQWLKQRGASYLAIVAVMGGAAVIAPVMWPGATALILLGLCVAAIAWRCASEPAAAEMRWYWLVATGSFLVTATIVDSAAAIGIFAAMWLVAGLALLLGTHVMKVPWLTLPGSLMVLLSAVIFGIQVDDLVDSTGYASLAAFVVVVGTLYIVRMVLLSLVRDPQVRRGSLLTVALGGGAVFALWAVGYDSTALLGATAFTVVAVLGCVDVPPARRRLVMDIAVLACAVAWFWACSVYVDLGFFWFVQWTALALAALAVIRYQAKQAAAGKGMLMAAAVAASLGGFLTIFSGDTLQQLVSLLVFVALLAVGMGLDERVFTIWGAVGVATAVIWYLRGFTYILLALLALGLIAFAIWRLNRKKPQGTEGMPMDPGIQPPPPPYMTARPETGHPGMMGQQTPSPPKSAPQQPGQQPGPPQSAGQQPGSPEQPPSQR
ncbi:hypothetical protein AS189_05220 [Arthrobacter alpinus]|uniref:DUF2339 domain-containing protein n=1 Tax=Arthrobacter alpinus TaxID=656366 RepID=A0A0S2LWZ0_9MICC|nr:hypothetical protein [Arthrobacter alpinus]ALO66004.1 hypothetical protein AS189_05220 [Arthrobacter alpinus]